ncbi:Tetracycline resistance protein, class B [Synechococcus sp. MIT S9509]|nr:Tetracycline resistance protein, class B [Synechococcus sp. MIT S9509]
MTNQPVKRSQTLRLVFLTLVNDRVARTLINCILPYIVVRFHLSGLMLGLIMASITLTSAVSAPIAGRLSDRCGRRKTLLGCLGISTVGMSIFGFASTVPALFTGRLVDGIGGGSEATSEAVIADITPRKDQTKTFGLVAMASVIGLIVGPGLGGLFASLNVRLPVWIASIMLFLNVILIAAGFQETRRSDSPKQPFALVERSWPKLIGFA